MTSAHRPDYLVRIGGQQVSPAAGSALVGLTVRTAKREGAGEAVLVLGTALADAVQHGDKVRIELGGSGKRALVFSGVVYGIEPMLGLPSGQRQFRVRAYDDLMKLMASGKRSKSFENQRAGDVVKAHAADAGVALGSIEDGVRMAHCYLHQQTPYDQCVTLAERNGFDLYVTEEGKLTFARFVRRAADHVLKHGVDILRATLRMQPAPRGVTVVPESPASSTGDDTVTWLVKDPSAHSATEGEANVCVIGAPALRTRDAASTAAKAIAERARALARTAELLLPGREAIRLGHAVEINGVPDVRFDGLFEVRGFTHTVDRAVGFRTLLDLASMKP